MMNWYFQRCVFASDYIKKIKLIQLIKKIELIQLIKKIKLIQLIKLAQLITSSS